MYRHYKREEFGLPATIHPISDGHSRTQNRAEPADILLPAPTSSAKGVTVMASAEATKDILEKIRETVDQEGHGSSFVFVIMGASVSSFFHVVS